MFDLSILLDALPALAGLAAPYITQVVKGVKRDTRRRLPKIARAPFAVLVGAAGAGLVGAAVPEVSASAASVVGAFSGLASVAGFKVGKAN